MEEDFKEWLCEKAGYLYLAYKMLEEKGFANVIELLIKAKWELEGKDFETAKKELIKTLEADYEFEKNK